MATASSRTLLVSLSAAVLAALLFLAPVGISNAQDTSTDAVDDEVVPATDVDSPTQDGLLPLGPADPTADRPELEELVQALAARAALTPEQEAAAIDARAEAAARADRLVQLFAAELGVEVDDLAAAGRAVLVSVLADAEADGDLTAEMVAEALAAYDEAAAAGIAELILGLPIVNPGQLDLSGMDLSGMDLSGMDEMDARLDALLGSVEAPTATD